MPGVLPEAIKEWSPSPDGGCSWARWGNDDVIFSGKRLVMPEEELFTSSVTYLSNLFG